MKQVHQSQVFLIRAAQQTLKFQLEIVAFTKRGYRPSLLTQVVCIRLCAHSLKKGCFIRHLALLLLQIYQS